jgi:hypothetical protein
MSCRLHCFRRTNDSHSGHRLQLYISQRLLLQALSFAVHSSSSVLEACCMHVSYKRRKISSSQDAGSCSASLQESAPPSDVTLPVTFPPERDTSPRERPAAFASEREVFHLFYCLMSTFWGVPYILEVKVQCPRYLSDDHWATSSPCTQQEEVTSSASHKTT